MLFVAKDLVEVEVQVGERFGSSYHVILADLNPDDREVLEASTEVVMRNRQEHWNVADSLPITTATPPHVLGAEARNSGSRDLPAKTNLRT